MLVVVFYGVTIWIVLEVMVIFKADGWWQCWWFSYKLLDPLVCVTNYLSHDDWHGSTWQKNYIIQWKASKWLIHSISWINCLPSFWNWLFFVISPCICFVLFRSAALHSYITKKGWCWSCVRFGEEDVVCPYNCNYQTEYVINTEPLDCSGTTFFSTCWSSEKHNHNWLISFVFSCIKFVNNGCCIIILWFGSRAYFKQSTQICVTVGPSMDQLH